MLKSIKNWWNRPSKEGDSSFALGPFLETGWLRFRSLPWGQWLRFKWIAPSLERLTSITLKLGTLLLVGFFLVFFVRLFKDQGYVIQSVSVPKQLMDQGYTGQVIALRIQDELAELKELAVTVKADSLQLKGDQQDIDLSVLGVGLSLRSLAFQLREVLGRENKTVRGEITRIGDRYDAQVRMTGFNRIEAQAVVEDGQEVEALEQLFRRIAEGILYETDPYRLALVQRRENRYDEAVETIRHYLKTYEEEAHWAYLCWGSLLRDLDRTEEAIEKFEKSIELKPDFNLPYVNVAWAYNELDKPLEAIKAFKRVIELEPDNVWRRNNLGWLYYNNDMPEAADSIYEHALATMDLDPVTRGEFATSWAEMKLSDDNIPEAKRIVDTYVESYSENVFSYLIKGISAFGEQDTVRALALLADAFELDPGDNGAISSNIGFNSMLGEYEAAISFYQRADWTEIGKWNKINNFNQAAMAFNNLALHDSAFVAVHRAISVDQEVAYPYTTLAETYFFTGQRDSCFHYLTLALEMGFNVENFDLEEEPYTYLVELPEFQRLIRKYTDETVALKN